MNQKKKKKKHLISTLTYLSSKAGEPESTDDLFSPLRENQESYSSV